MLMATFQQPVEAQAAGLHSTGRCSPSSSVTRKAAPGLSYSLSGQRLSAAPGVTVIVTIG